MAKNADICRVLFAALPDYYFKCKYCGTVRRQLPSSGYGNLMSHLKDKHAEYEADYLAHASSHAETLHSFGFVNDKIANIYHWMEWVVDRNMPLSEVDKPRTLSMSRLKPICSKTLKRYMTETTKTVERAIAAIIPSIFGVMYDGWLCFSEHFVATYIVFWRDDQLHCVLLAMTPLDEADQTAASHVTFIRNILVIYGQLPAHLRF
uniref:BED-type domain-containing protein n=1 Tax=Phytophthora ramorum TaxID=164328 RepID=H3H714_PHYRM